jgi:hypothetical protein
MGGGVGGFGMGEGRGGFRERRGQPWGGCMDLQASSQKSAYSRSLLALKWVSFGPKVGLFDTWMDLQMIPDVETYDSNSAPPVCVCVCVFVCV